MTENTNTLVYLNWTLENYKELFKLVTGKDMPVILSNFMYGYYSILSNKDKFQSLGYADFRFKNYHENIARFYASNFEKVNQIDNQFYNIFQKPDGTFMLSELKDAIYKDYNFFALLKNIEMNPVVLFKADILQVLCYVAERYISYYHSKELHYIDIVDLENNWEKVIREAHQSKKCSFSFDYGWISVEEWMSLLDIGRGQVCANPNEPSRELRFNDFVLNLVGQKAHQRNKNALNVLKLASTNYIEIEERANANNIFMSNIIGSVTFKKIVEGLLTSVQWKKGKNN